MAIRVGVNLLAVSPARSGGIALYVRSLLQPLLEESDLLLTAFTNSENHEWIADAAPSLCRVRLPILTRPQAWRVAAEQVALPRLCRTQSIQLLHSPTYTGPIASSVPTVVTICDMLYRVHPEAVPWPKRLFWSVLVPICAQRARRILTLSAHAKEDIVTLLRVPALKVVVTPLAGQRLADPNLGESSALRPLATRRYILSVGALGAHKNAQTLVRGIHALHQRADLRDVQLVLAGRDYGPGAGLKRLANDLGLTDSICLVGQVSSAELAWLYSRAMAYVTLSEFEGFGMTVLEAMSAGVPVVCSDASALPEVAGAAALLVAPRDVKGVAAALARLLDDPRLRADLVSKGLERSRSFSWGHTAKLTAAAYRDAVVGLGNLPAAQ